MIHFCTHIQLVPGGLLLLPNFSCASVKNKAGKIIVLLDHSEMNSRNFRLARFDIMRIESDPHKLKKEG